MDLLMILIAFASTICFAIASWQTRKLIAVGLFFMSLLFLIPMIT